MRKLAIGLLLLTLTACGAASTGNSSDSTGSAPSTAPAASPAMSPAAGGDTSVSGTPGTGFMGDMGDLEKNVATLLSSTVSKPADSLTLQNKEEMQWPNGALGCPDPNMMYTEMIVPGYKLTYTDGSQTYEVHTDQTGTSAILCDKGAPKPLK